MQSPAHWSRRKFLSTRGLASSAGGFLGALFSEPRGPGNLQPQIGRGHCCVARRAMACEFGIYLPEDTPRPVEAAQTALDEIEVMEDLLTVYRADSAMSYVNDHAAERPVRVDARLFAVLKRAAELTQQTGGAFDASAGALVKVWGFFRGPRRVPSEAERIEALSRSGMGHVRLDEAEMTVHFDRPGVEFNLGSIGKGYAIDQAILRARERHGVRAALMQGGCSSLYGLGSPRGDGRGWLVGIENPYNPRENVARVRLLNKAMGTSGTANQYFEHEGRRYGHVLDPRSGWPADDVAAVSVVADDAATADALSTGLFVLGLDKAVEFCQNHPEISAFIVLKPDAGPAPTGRPRVLTLNVPPMDVQISPEFAAVV